MSGPISENATSVESFHVRLRSSWVLILVIACCWVAWKSSQSYMRYGDLSAAAVVFFAVVNAGMWSVALWNHRRPVLEVSDREIVFGDTLSLRRKHVPLEDVVELVTRSPLRLTLKTRTGRPVKIRLFGIPKAQRGAARAAIERRVAERVPPAP